MSLFPVTIRRPLENFTNNVSSFLLSLYAQYSLEDSYFMYHKQPIFLSRIGLEYLDDPNNWNPIDAAVIVVYMLYRVKNNSAQYFRSTNFYQSTPIYFNAFNFFTLDVIFTSSAANTQAADGSTYRVFSVGGAIVSYITEETEHNAFSRPTPIKANGNPAKQGLNGLPLDLNTEFAIQGPEGFMDQLIFYPLELIPTLTFSDSNQKNFVSNTELVTQTVQLKFFLINLIRTSRIAEYSDAYKIVVTGGTQKPLIDNIFLATRPICGNSNLLWDGSQTGGAFFYIRYGDTIEATVKNDGSGAIIPGTDRIYVLKRDELKTAYLFQHSIDLAASFPQYVWSNDFEGGPYTRRDFTTTLVYRTNNIFQWTKNNLVIFEVPSPTVSIYASIYKLDSIVTHSSNQYSKTDYSELNDILGMANPVTGRASKSLFTKFLAYNEAGENYALDGSFYDEFLAQEHNFKMLKLYENLNWFNIATSIVMLTDNKPFNLGMRYFNGTINKALYYEIIDWYRLSINIKFVPVPILMSDGKYSIGEFKINNIFPVYQQVAFFMLPRATQPKNEINNVLYSSISRTRRGELLPLFIANETDAVPCWQELNNLSSTFTIYQNNYANQVFLDDQVVIFMIFR